MNVNKHPGNYHYRPNECGLYTEYSSVPTRILFEWFEDVDTNFRIYTRMKRFIIRMKLVEQFLKYDKTTAKKVFNEKQIMENLGEGIRSKRRQ